MKRLVSLLSLAALLLGVGAAPATAAVTHERHIRHKFHFTQHEVNFCGNTGTYSYVSTGHIFFAWRADGSFHLNSTMVNRWTVVYDDPALGTRTGKSTVTNTGTTRSDGRYKVFHESWNLREGPLTIRNRTTLVWDAKDRLRVQNQVVRVKGC
ncbi:hypothetical protein [Actinopolymorpha singaporensis]|uniref:Uncharacterized protein n=1 Tax=Actinopolymorpha singaporensis TaxID=117157 RepID=A0A1H1QXK2_9ACTN|nr:hypothetical protein [Actinopolymorpha singaporensis]SDS28157.1 hypothetical protein SAMN04489717_2189 [Actinopolymorpha singaporensis]